MNAWWNPFSSTLEVFADTYAKSPERLKSALIDAVRRQLREVDLVLVLSHFPETFFAWQDELVGQGFDAQVLRPPVHASSLPLRALPAAEVAGVESSVDETADDGASRSDGALVLALGEMLDSERARAGMERRRVVSLIVTERHPLPRHDRRILEFARSLPYRVRLGYFISLQDPLVSPFLGEWTEMLLEQWGFNEANLITSDLVTRRLDRARARLEKQIAQEVLCESPLDWLRRNGAGTHYANTIDKWLASQERWRDRRERAMESELDEDELDEDFD